MNTPRIEDLLPKAIEKQPAVPQGMKTFTIYRTNDETGVSGTGIIIQGCLFANGMCAIQWLCQPEPGDTSVKEWEKWLNVHVRSHPSNKTIITFDDKTQLVFGPKESTPEPLVTDS